jgi:hypothetical protein
MASESILQERSHAKSLACLAGDAKSRVLPGNWSANSETFYPQRSQLIYTSEQRTMKITVWIASLLVAVSMPAQDAVRIQGQVIGIPAGLTDGFLRVLLTGRSLNQPLVAPVRPDGSFEFTAVPVGMYSLQEDISMMAGILRPTPVNLTADKDLQGITVTAAPQLVGEIGLEDGKPLPADENVTDPAFRLEMRGQKSGRKRPLFLRSDGIFGFSPLSQDEYEVRVPVMPKGYFVKSITYGGNELLERQFKTTGKDFSFLRIILSRTTAPTSSATLVVTQSGRGAAYIEGAFSYFEVRSTNSDAVRLKTRLGGQACYLMCGPSPASRFDSTSFTIPAGTYQISGYIRGCDGNCGRLGPADRECRATFSIASGQTLYANRMQSSESCEMDILPTKPAGVR